MFTFSGNNGEIYHNNSAPRSYSKKPVPEQPEVQRLQHEHHDKLEMPPPALPGVLGHAAAVRPKKSFFKSKSQSVDKTKKGLYKHSFGVGQNKDDELREKVFHKAITSMDFDDDGLTPSDMSFRHVISTHVQPELPDM